MNNVSSVNIVLCRFVHNNGNIATEKTHKIDYTLLLLNDFKGSL